MKLIKKPTVYLGGPMEGVDEDSWHWRQQLKSDPALEMFTTFLDPTLRKAFHLQEYTPNLCRKVMATDLFDIDRSDIIFANLKDRGDGKCWGTVMEIMYAYQQGKIVITVLENDLKHPFVEACSTIITPDFDEAVKELKDFIAWMN